jgi:ketosteroid isomerase-like protein
VERACDPAVVLEAPGDAFTEGDWHGHDGVVSFVANQMEVLEDMWLRLDELVEHAPDRLIAAIPFGGRARYSALEVEMQPFHVFRLRDGKVLSWQIVLTREQALAAAGRE